MNYRCNYLGRDGRIISTQIIRATNDADALATAHKIYAESKELRHGFEVWADTYFVHFETTRKDCEGARTLFVSVGERKGGLRRRKLGRAD
jgi:hypothetical protein